MITHDHYSWSLSHGHLCTQRKDLLSVGLYNTSISRGHLRQKSPAGSDIIKSLNESCNFTLFCFARWCVQLCHFCSLCFYYHWNSLNDKKATPEPHDFKKTVWIEHYTLLSSAHAISSPDQWHQTVSSSFSEEFMEYSSIWNGYWSRIYLFWWQSSIKKIISLAKREGKTHFKSMIILVLSNVTIGLAATNIIGQLSHGHNVQKMVSW